MTPTAGDLPGVLAVRARRALHSNLDPREACEALRVMHVVRGLRARALAGAGDASISPPSGHVHVISAPREYLFEYFAEVEMLDSEVESGTIPCSQLC